MSRVFTRYIALLCAILALLSIGGVFATWRYAGEIEDVGAAIPLQVREFAYDQELPSGEAALLEKLYDILNNKYSNDIIPEGESTEYLLSTMDKDWTAGHNPALGSFVGSMDPTEESRARINAMFGDIINLDEVSFILKAEDLVGSVEDEIALYSTSDKLKWSPDYWTPMVVGVYLTVFAPVIDDQGATVGYELLCGPIHGYCMEVAYMEGDNTPSFSTDHWRDELFYWHESHATPLPITGEDRYKYECYHPADGNYPYPGRTKSWFGWINVQSSQWEVGEFTGKKARQCVEEILNSQS